MYRTMYGNHISIQKYYH